MDIQFFMIGFKINSKRKRKKWHRYDIGMRLANEIFWRHSRLRLVTSGLTSFLLVTSASRVTPVWLVLVSFRELRQTTFAGEVGRVACPRRTHAITGYYVVTMGTHSRRRSTRNRLFLAIGRGLTLPTSTVRLEMFSSIQSTIDSLRAVRRIWVGGFFYGLGGPNRGVRGLSPGKILVLRCLNPCFFSSFSSRR